MRSTLAQATLAAALTGAFYAAGLAISPPHLLHDEIKFALQAKSIADTGRDLNSRYLPVYFLEPGFPVGRDPICIYVTAAVLKVLPLSEVSIRLPSALVGAAGAGLTFILARLLFGRDRMAWLAAGLLALTPIYFIHSRLALSVIYPVPFTLLWLITLCLYFSRARLRYACACGVVLGLGVYSYLSAAIMMPLYLTATAIVLLGRRDRRGTGAAVTAFAIMMVPIALWQAIEPDRYSEILTAYRLYDPQQMSPAEKLREIVSGPSLKLRIDTVWETFNPSRLFFTGESSLNISTRQVGSYLLPVAVFLGLGVQRLLRAPRTTLGTLVLFGLVSAPLPAVIMADVEIRRWLVAIPFVTIVTAFGVESLLGGGLRAQVACVVLLLLMPLQFLAFGRDYFGPYRERASFWFGGNIRGALEAVLEGARDRPPSIVYISAEIPWVEAYWRFYTTVHGQRSLLERTSYVRLQTADVPRARPGAVVVAPAQDATAGEALVSAGWLASRIVREPDGKPSFTVYATSGS